MRNLNISVLLVLIWVGQLIGQDTTLPFESITVIEYDENDRVHNRKTLTAEEAHHLDIPEFLVEKEDVARIQIVGTQEKDNVMYKLRFDSKTAPYDAYDHLCKIESTDIKPKSGLIVCSNDDFTGLRIKELTGAIHSNSQKLKVGQIITQFNDIPVSTPCDLSMAIWDCEVGKLVPMEIIDNGTISTIQFKVGGQMVKTISYEACDEPDLEIRDISAISETNSFSVFPNPSKGTSFINFESYLDEPIKFYVQAVDGSIIHSESRDYFSGNLRTSYDLSGLAAGTYFFVIEQGTEVYREKVMYIIN